MAKNKKDLLEQVSATIVGLSDGVGVYHLNKLTYLFEYFFIKNFGRRYTGEKFVKLPHGPVIQSVQTYKKLIESLEEQELVETDIDTLLKSRVLDDDYIFNKIPIKPKKLSGRTISNPMLMDLLKNIVHKFAGLKVEELEEFVYKTKPVVGYINNPFKKSVGGYVIVSDNIKLSDYRSEATDYQYKLLKEYEEKPVLDKQLFDKYSEEFQLLENLRPTKYEELIR